MSGPDTPTPAAVSRQPSRLLEALQGASTRELVSLLFRFGLAEGFLRALKEREVVFAAETLSRPETIHRQALDTFRQTHELSTEEDVERWCLAHGLDAEDLLSEAIHAYRAAEFREQLLKTSRESLYLRYKDKLDRVLYSLIRVEDPGLIQELYYSIEAGEIRFGDAAERYSCGPESKTQGIIGPVDLTTPHPEIASRLRTASPGVMSEPFLASEWHSIIRLEYRFESVFDDATKEFLEDISFRSYLGQAIKDDQQQICTWLRQPEP